MLYRNIRFAKIRILLDIANKMKSRENIYIGKVGEERDTFSEEGK